MKVRNIMLFFVCCMAGYMVVSCDEEETLTPQVGVCLKNTNNEWKRSFRTHAIYTLENYGLKYSIQEGTSEAIQNIQIDSLVKRGVEALVIAPEGNPTAGLTKASEAGIPLIFTEVAPVENYAVLVQIDNKAIGESAAAFFNKQQNISKIALFSVKQDEATSEARIQAIHSALKDGMETVIVEVANYTSDAGRRAINEILASHADINAIYAQDDDVALGVLAGLGTSERIRAIVGCGGSRIFCDKIIKTLHLKLATTLYSPKELVENAIAEANDIINTGDIPVRKTVNLESELIDIENVAAYINE